MRIGLNALQVRAAKSGVGQYIDGLIDGLCQCLDDTDRLLVYATPLNAGNYRRDDPRVRLRVVGPGARRAVRLAWEWMALPGVMAKDELDVFHGPANFLPRRLPCPAVVTIHDASRWVDPTRFTRANLFYWRAMTRHTLRLGTPVITVSQAAKRDLVAHLGIAPERIHVIHEAAHPRFRPIEVEPAPAPFVLHVGTIEPGKNLVALVQAFARFRTAHADWRLVLAGDRGWKVEAVFEAIEREGLREAVQYVGHVSDERLVALYNQAALFVFPSLNEGFGLPPLEAMQCGTPVVASNRSSLPEVLGEAPLYVEPTDVGALAEAMARVADDAVLRDRLRHAGLQQARSYSWAQTARRTAEILKRLTGRPPISGALP